MSVGPGARGTFPDLADARLGARVVAASDEFFAPAERLLAPEPPAFHADRYTDRGKWMDGWETRRRRGPGHDWCVVRLGAPAVVHGVDVDTTHFRGNHPERAAVEACAIEGPAVDERQVIEEAPWETLVPETGLQPDASNPFAVVDPRRWTHVRLVIHPDGGVARLRIYGEARPDWARLAAGPAPVDLAAAVHGGRVWACSDACFGAPGNLLLPGPSAGMMDGWETRRRRGPGHDSVVIRLGTPGTVLELEVDTTHFKGNHPDGCAVAAIMAPDLGAEDALGERIPWTEILPRTKLSPDTRHRFELPRPAWQPASHVRLDIHPDGGVARFRVLGAPLAGL